MIYQIPKILKVNDVPSFLAKIENIFTMQNKMEPDVVIDFSKVNKLSIISLLIIYKLIDYTYSHYCFKKPNIITNPYLEDQWTRYGFISLIQSYLSNKDISEYYHKTLKIHIEDSFFIAPQSLLREDNKRQILNKQFYPKINNYYSYSEKTVSMICQCLSEIFLNFWAHAIDDKKSILIAKGNKNIIEIACADTGNGIISTLGKTLRDENLTKEEIMLRAIKKGVTSKKMTNHMGYGLWVLDEIATITKGRFHLYSQGVYYYNNSGKKKCGKCGYWQGTIVYLQLPLLNPKTLVDIQGLIEGEDKLKLNW